MKDQTLVIRVQELRGIATTNGERITDLEAVKTALDERKHTKEQLKDLLARAILKEVKRPTPPPVPEPNQLHLFVFTEPICIRDGENGNLWIPPEQATIDQQDEANDQALQYLETQAKRRKRIKADIGQARELAGGDGKALYNATVRSLGGAS